MTTDAFSRLCKCNKCLMMQTVCQWHSVWRSHQSGDVSLAHTTIFYTFTKPSLPLLITPTRSSVSNQSATPTLIASSVTSRLTSLLPVRRSPTVECLRQTLNDLLATIALDSGTGHSQHNASIYMSTTNVYPVYTHCQWILCFSRLCVIIFSHSHSCRSTVRPDWVQISVRTEDCLYTRYVIWTRNFTSPLTNVQKQCICNYEVVACSLL